MVNDGSKRSRRRTPAQVSYAEKLQDPRWQKRRLEVMERADFRCQWCGCGDETLHIHHGCYYKAGAPELVSMEPWEYPLDALWCLCATCHEVASHRRATVLAALAQIHPNADELIMAMLRVYVDWQDLAGLRFQIGDGVDPGNQEDD